MNSLLLELYPLNLHVDFRPTIKSIYNMRLYYRGADFCTKTRVLYFFLSSWIVFK